jgi:hypothetical protein
LKAAQIVNQLLEVGPDEINPKREMLRVDPAADIKEIVHALQNEGILTLAYKRAADILKLHVKLTEWTTEERLENWLHVFLTGQLNLQIDIHGMTTRNLGPDYSGTAYEVMFPLKGQPTPFTKLV